MKINLDPALEMGWVYRVSVKVIQPLPRGVGKQEASHETTFNLRQPETAIDRTIKAVKFDKEKVISAEVTMVKKLTLSCIS